jgi:ABC-2 type transport system permease protein
VTPLQPGMFAVAAREVAWIRRDPVMRFLLLGMPVIAFALLSLTFSSAVVRGLDVAIVDRDNTPLSRLFVQTVAAAPGIAVTQRANDLRAAASAIRAGQAIAAIYLPPEFEKDLLAGRRPRPIAFYNTQYFTPGNLASKSIQDAMTAASAAVAPATVASSVVHANEGQPGMTVEEYTLTNPALSYAQFLLRALLPTVLTVVIAICAGYAVGSEFRRRDLRTWWDSAGHSIAAAVVGKMLPYFGVLMSMFVLMVGILDVGLGVSFRGNAILVAVSAALLTIAYQLIGCLMQLLARSLDVGLSVTGIIVSPAFGFVGVGFPVIGMHAFPRAVGALFPLRWYIQILFDQASRGAPLRQTAEPFVILCGLTAVLAFLVWLCFGALIRGGMAVPAEEEPAHDLDRSGVAGAFRAEWRRVLTDRSVRSLFVLAPILYAFYYPQPYLGQLVRNVPIAVVDQDGTELSHALIQTLEAHGNISVALRAISFREAQDAIFARQAFGILGIPPDTEKNVLKGVQARLPVYADSTYMVLYNRTLQGILESVQAYADDALRHGARIEGAGTEAAASLLEPVQLVMVPLFNPTASYSSYVVPAAFVIIVWQTLLMGSAMLGGSAFEQGGPAALQARASASAILGQGLAHWTIYIPALLLYLVIMPRVYGFSTLGSIWPLVAISFPFVLATSFLGQALGLLFRHRETAVLLAIATTLPIFFLVGVSWPIEAIPDFLRRASEVVPAVSAIDGIVRINQMGASLEEVRPRWDALWILTLVYYALAVLLAHLHAWRRRINAVVV